MAFIPSAALDISSADARQQPQATVAAEPAMALIPTAALDLPPSSQPRWLQRARRREENLPPWQQCPQPEVSRRSSNVISDASTGEAHPPRSDPEPEHQRHLITASTSSSSAKSAAMPTHTEPPTLASDSTEVSLPSHSPLPSLDSLPPGFHSSRASSDTSYTFSSSSAPTWITCSDNDGGTSFTSPMASRSALGRAKVAEQTVKDTQHQRYHRKRIFDAMASAFDRRKKRNLPRELNSGLQVTRGNIYHHFQISKH